MNRIIKLAVLPLLVLWSCGSTSYITSSWKAPGAASKKYEKIVVLGLIREADRTLREKMEQHIVSDLKKLGYDAVCSCDEFNPKAFEGLDEKQAIAKLRDSGVDAVLTVTLLNKEKEKYYIPDRIINSPYSIYHDRFYQYYHTMYDRIYSKEYFLIDTKYFWESNFYDLETNTLVYSAQSQSFDPTSTEKLSHEYGLMIVKDMTKKNLITNQKVATSKPM